MDQLWWRCHPNPQESMYLLVIGPLTPLADAISADTEGCLKKIGALYIQGQAVVDDESGLLKPWDIAFNIREDLEGATEVFDQVPIAAWLGAN